MSRKSKAKYEMKGHSVPGVKGFKDTTLEDGRPASSALQMQSPLYVETKPTVELETSDPTANLNLSEGMDKSLTKSSKESSAQYLMRQKMLFDQRKKAREEEEAKSSVEKLNAKTTEYDEEEQATESQYAKHGTDPRQDKNNYDEHGNYKPDRPEMYPDFEIAPTLSSEGTTESLINDQPIQ